MKSEKYAFGAHCPLMVRQRARTGKPAWARSHHGPFGVARPYVEKEVAAPVENALEQQGRALVQLALAEVQGNQSVAAKSLRIGRGTLRYRMKKYNLL